TPRCTPRQPNVHALSSLSRARPIIPAFPPDDVEGLEPRLGKMRRGVLAALAAATALLSINGASATGAPTLGPDSHLPVPRYVSLRTEGANGRHGPSVQQRVDWIYEHAGLPLQVTGESGPWRRVRDPDGTETWMHAQNLEPRRTVYVKQVATLRRDPH